MTARRLVMGLATVLLLSGVATAARAAENGVSISPAEGVPGDAVDVSSTWDGDATACEIDWDTTVVQQAGGSCGAGGTPVVIPVSGPPGTHLVTMCDGPCADAADARGSAQYVVDAIVPSLDGDTLRGADAVLAEAGLVAAAADGAVPADALVTGSVPSAGATVPPSATVVPLVPPPAVVLTTDVLSTSTTDVLSTSTTPSSSSSSAATSRVRSSTDSSTASSPVASSTTTHGTPGPGLWIVVGALVLGALLWWLRRRSVGRLARHAALPRAAGVTVTVGAPRSEIRLDRGSSPAATVDVRTRTATTTTLTFGDDDDH